MADGEKLLELAAAWLDEGISVALATVIETWGSSPCPPGSHLVVNAQGEFRGSVSGGCIEGAVVAEAARVLAGGEPARLSFGVSDEMAWEVGLACGGEVEIYLEPLT
ncbi:MAG: XdhC family protein [Myxococcota bacterium]|jgi:xanthine/CO dehydrogenase XdhC/CoxF family maturation factor|nr:XdhC family protein [Myxococcota bacterium]